MGRSGETFSKKEKEKKRLKKRQEKEEKAEQRKANSSKGKSFEEQLAYVDELGNLSPVPADPKKRPQVKVTEDGLVETIREKDEEEDVERTGVVTFFNTDKGYGFIKDDKTREGIFVHINNLDGPLKERDKVHFKIQQADRGPQAVDVKIAE